MAIKKASNWFLLIFSFIFGVVINQMLEKWFEFNWKLLDLSQQLIIACSVMLVIAMIIFLKKVNNELDTQIETLRKESLLPLQNRYYCSFIQNHQERLEKMSACIQKAEKYIYILSDLGEHSEVAMPKHKAYLQNLNMILKNTDIKFLRIIVPKLKKPIDSYRYQPEIFDEILSKHPGYKEHFETINHYRNEALIASRKTYPLGFSILLIDDRYLFLFLDKKDQKESLAEILEGGFFFEDFTGNLTYLFRNYFENMLKGTIILKKHQQTS